MNEVVIAGEAVRIAKLTGLLHPKVTDRHLGLSAVVSVRQFAVIAIVFWLLSKLLSNRTAHRCLHFVGHHPVSCNDNK